METEPDNATPKQPLLSWPFKLLMLLIIMIILLIFVPVIFMPNYRAHPTGHITAAKTEIQSIRTALDAFEVDCGRYPTTREGLAPLVQSLSDATSATWRGPYLDKIFLDPWGKPFRYLYPGINHPTSYEIISAGPDGKFDTDDDITNFNLDGK